MDHGNNSKDYEKIRKSDKKVGLIFGFVVLVFLGVGRYYKYSRKVSTSKEHERLSRIVKHNKETIDSALFSGGAISGAIYDIDGAKGSITVKYFFPKSKILSEEEFKHVTTRLGSSLCTVYSKVVLGKEVIKMKYIIFHSKSKMFTFVLSKGNCQNERGEEGFRFSSGFSNEGVSHPEWK